MALKLKYFPKSGHIRSIGSAPNGILGITKWSVDVAQFLVSPTVTPLPPPGQGEAVVSHTLGADPLEEGATALSADEAIAAAADHLTAAMLWRSVSVALEFAATRDLPRFEPEAARNLAVLAVETRDALIAHGFVEVKQL